LAEGGYFFTVQGEQEFRAPAALKCRNSMAFYLGLSFLSKTAYRGHASQHAEGLRVLGLLDGKAPFLETEPSGRPFFGDGHAGFSISHSRRMVAVAYSTDGARVGCDIQYAHPRKTHDKIAARLFSAEELRYLAEASGAREKRLRFCRLWALKECFLKAHGLPVFAMKKIPPRAPGVFHVYELDGRYALAVMRDGPGADVPPNISWFSPQTLPLKEIGRLHATESEGTENTAGPRAFLSYLL
jgi:phosphopantetheinyl transferase